MYKLLFKQQAVKVLCKLPRNIALKIRAKLQILAENPKALVNNISALKGTGALRLMVDDFRIIYTINKQKIEIIVIKIASRGTYMINNTQIIKQGGKPAFAVLPYQEYEKLMEQLEDLQDKKDIQYSLNFNSESIPLEVVDKLLTDENNLKIWREYRTMHQHELAKRANVSQAYISDIESGKKIPSMKSAKKIATALNIDFALLDF